MVPTERIKQLQNIVRPYRAKAKEDRGDFFIKGTPDIVLKYKNAILSFMIRRQPDLTENS